MSKNTKIALALGGNLGDSEKIFREAGAGLIAGGCRNLLISRIFRYPAVDCVPDTPDFSNAAVVAEWAGSPEELLALCQRLERAAGRPAEHSSRESRPLDIDLILFGDSCFEWPELTVPHPRALDRRFVLEPLAELIPEEPFPGTGCTVRECLRNLSAPD